MLRFFCFLGMCLFLSQSTQAQFRQIRQTIKKFYENTDTLRTSSLLPVPDFGITPEKGVEVGGMLINTFYLDPKDKNSYASSYLAGGGVSTKNVQRIGGRWNIWFPDNEYHFAGESWYIYQPFYYYGVGANTQEINKDLVTLRWIKCSMEFEKKLAPHYYLGLNTFFESNKFSAQQPSGYFTLDDYRYGKEGGKVLFMGLNQVFDSRNSSTYPTEGLVFKISYSYAPNLFKDNVFQGSLSAIDIRNYASLDKRTIVAVNMLYQNIQGSNTPFFLMPTLGGDKVFRGYYAGRYLGTNLSLLQTELRYRLIRRIGLVGIAGIGSVFNDTITTASWKPNYGAGIRYFFDLEKSLAVRIDYVFGEKRPNENRQQGLYISVGEAF